jgi:hypothetical protein
MAVSKRKTSWGEKLKSGADQEIFTSMDAALAAMAGMNGDVSIAAPQHTNAMFAATNRTNGRGRIVLTVLPRSEEKHDRAVVAAGRIEKALQQDKDYNVDINIGKNDEPVMVTIYPPKGEVNFFSTNILPDLKSALNALGIMPQSPGLKR